MPQRLSGWLPLAALAALLAAAPGRAPAKGGAYLETRHGDRAAGVLRVRGIPRGECAHCHGSPRDAAGRKDGGGHTRLFSLNDNGLCLGCHARASGAWLGARLYEASSHGTSPVAAWPGPDPRGRPPGDAGKCLNCHDPHGVKDQAGLIPHLLRLRGAALCLGCHAGAPAKDVASAFAKSFRHPLVAQVDPGAAAATPSAAGVALPPGPATQAGTCTGCHNPHAAAGRQAMGGSAQALLGVRRVRISNGAPGTPPLRTPLEPADTVAVREHEVCLACHGGARGGSTLAQEVTAARSLELGAAFNPANASFHPVEAQGRNPGVDRRAFSPGWSAERLVTCSDCHGSDEDAVRGPHGSNQPHLLRKRLPTGGPLLQLLETDLCFDCHAWRTYADPAAVVEQRYSRYPGHVVHAVRGLSCRECHEPHGAALPALLARRSPGLASYSQDASGGACTVTCHQASPATATYRVTYPR